MNIFEEAAVEYDEWFETHKWVYQSEVEAVRRYIPKTGEGIEIGVGTGRFSIPFGIKVGIEPAPAMAEIARKKNQILQGCQILFCQAGSGLAGEARIRQFTNLSNHFQKSR